MGTKNKLVDLNNHLFEQLERLNDDKLTDEELEQEIDRANAMAHIGSVIVNNSKVALTAMKLSQRGEADDELVTKFLGV